MFSDNTILETLPLPETFKSDKNVQQSSRTQTQKNNLTAIMNIVLKIHSKGKNEHTEKKEYKNRIK